MINTDNCIGCSLTCPNIYVCVHQLTCTSIDYKTTGNICKHVHTCIRVSKKKIGNFYWYSHRDTGL